MAFGVMSFRRVALVLVTKRITQFSNIGWVVDLLTYLPNVGHQFTSHPTLPATRVDAFLVPPPLINLPSFNQLLFPLL
jgi:hypothetical protein